MDKKLSKSAQVIFDYYKRLDQPFSADRLGNKFDSLDRYPELAGNKEFKQILISKKSLLLDDPASFLELKAGREYLNPPESHFWWYIDEL